MTTHDWRSMDLLCDVSCLVSSQESLQLDFTVRLTLKPESGRELDGDSSYADSRSFGDNESRKVASSQIRERQEDWRRGQEKVWTRGEVKGRRRKHGGIEDPGNARLRSNGTSMGSQLLDFVPRKPATRHHNPLTLKSGSQRKPDTEGRPSPAS